MLEGGSAATTGALHLVGACSATTYSSKVPGTLRLSQYCYDIPSYCDDTGFNTKTIEAASLTSPQLQSHQPHRIELYREALAIALLPSRSP
jgi:hypothetical protein